MMLRKTTIIPTDDRKLALAMLRQLIYEEPHVLFVVFGTGALAEKTVERADKIAGPMNEPRWVAWIRKPELVRELLDELKIPEDETKKLKNAIACALSLTDQVCDIVPKSPEPDLSRIYDAFENAEANIRA